MTYSKDYSKGGVQFGSPLSYTDNGFVTIAPRYDTFPGEKVEIFISGGLKESDKTFRWIPYPEDKPLELEAEPVKGYRFVHLRFREPGGEESSMYSLPFFLQPYAEMVTISGNKTLRLNKIPDLGSVSVEGCAETYLEIDPVTEIECTSPSPEVWVTYSPVHQEPVRVLAKQIAPY